MNLRDIANKIGSYISSKTQDDEGWIRQGKFTPVQQVQSQINYQKQTSPINCAIFAGLETVSKQITHSLAHIGALGATG